MYFKKVQENYELHKGLRKNPLEYAVILHNKYKDVYDSRIFKIEKDSGNEYLINYKTIDDNSIDRNIIEGFNFYQNFKNIEELKKELDCKNITDITDNIDDYELEKEYYNYLSEKMENYFIIKEKGKLYNNNGEEFNYKIVENSSNIVNSYIILDSLFLYSKDNEIIGYLNGQYTNLDVALLVNEHITAEEYKDDILKKKTIYTSDKINFLERYNIEYKKENIESIFKLKYKDLQMRLKDFENDYKIFKDTASIDYSYLNKNYRGNGLAKDMYFKLSNYFIEKDFKLRSSSLRSPFAEGFWNKMIKEYPNLIGKYETKDYLNGCFYIKKKSTEVFNKNKKIKPHIC